MKPEFVRTKLPAPSGVPGVYAGLDELIGLQYTARDFSFLPRQPLSSVLSGRHASRMRGRGLDFDEIRKYLPGDDIRSIDWNVTARTGEAHTRVFTEERDRPAYLLVDQRVSMFWGTRRALKSVVAAEIAALAAWRVIGQGDRVGGLVFDDTDVAEVRPQRSQTAVLQLLRTIVTKNHALRAGSGVPSRPAMLNRVLHHAVRLAHHDCMVVVISDFDGADEETENLLRRIEQSNDAVCALVLDPSALEIPDDARMVVSDGALQVEIEGRATKKLAAFAKGRIDRILAWPRTAGVPVLPVDTEEPVLAQLRRLLGFAPARGTRG